MLTPRTYTPQVALRCIAGEAPSDTLRESGWIDRGVGHSASREGTQGEVAEEEEAAAAAWLASVGAADAAIGEARSARGEEGGVEKDCLLDFRPIDGLQLSEPESANTPTSDQTAVSLTLRRWYARRALTALSPVCACVWLYVYCTCVVRVRFHAWACLQFVRLQHPHACTQVARRPRYPHVG